ncbi:MAG: hypothetical protein OQK35_00955 [Alphaproteobacteria bacterium]|nr:hypothetical protein [Alphaproteobacteria bacterium]
MAHRIIPFIWAAILFGTAACSGPSNISTSTQPEEGLLVEGSKASSSLSIALNEAKRPLAGVSGRVPGGNLLPPETKKFLGLNGLDLQKVMGDPTFKRRDRQVEVWQYGKENCILDFFLYNKTGEFRVTHMEFRGRDVVKIEKQACLSHLLQEKSS